MPESRPATYSGAMGPAPVTTTVPVMARGPAAPPTPGRRFLCRRCRHGALVGVVEPHAAARCLSCGWSTNDLLTLVPVRPTGLARLVLGGGGRALLRVGMFVAVCAAMIALVMAGR